MTYDNLTDRELLRHVQNSTDPIVRALAERLEMRHRDIEEMIDQTGCMRPGEMCEAPRGKDFIE
jgi:hypothetical protein